MLQRAEPAFLKQGRRWNRPAAYNAGQRSTPTVTTRSPCANGGSTAWLFEIVDDGGDVLYSAAASGVTGITESLATSFDPAVIQVTAGGQHLADRGRDALRRAAGRHMDPASRRSSARQAATAWTPTCWSRSTGTSAPTPVVGTDLRIPAVTFESFQTQPNGDSSMYEGGSNPNLDHVLDVNSMSQSYTAALPGGTDGNRILVIDDAGHLLATAPLTRHLHRELRHQRCQPGQPGAAGRHLRRPARATARSCKPPAAIPSPAR